MVKGTQAASLRYTVPIPPHTIPGTHLMELPELSWPAVAALPKSTPIVFPIAALEQHGIWGDPDGVIAGIERHRALGVSDFVIEFFGRDTRVPARLFAEKVMPAFASEARSDA